MKTFNRICIEDYESAAGSLTRGTEYTTSEAINGVVTVFSTPYWFTATVDKFAGEITLTGSIDENR